MGSTCNLKHLHFVIVCKHSSRLFMHLSIFSTTLPSFCINICFIFLQSVFYTYGDVEIIIMNSLGYVFYMEGKHTEGSGINVTSELSETLVVEAYWWNTPQGIYHLYLLNDYWQYILFCGKKQTCLQCCSKL